MLDEGETSHPPPSDFQENIENEIQKIKDMYAQLLDLQNKCIELELANKESKNELKLLANTLVGLATHISCREEMMKELIHFWNRNYNKLNQLSEEAITHIKDAKEIYPHYQFNFQPSEKWFMTDIEIEASNVRPPVFNQGTGSFLTLSKNEYHSLITEELGIWTRLQRT
jgi:hypothetical protein